MDGMHRVAQACRAELGFPSFSKGLLPEPGSPLPTRQAQAMPPELEEFRPVGSWLSALPKVLQKGGSPAGGTVCTFSSSV